MINEPKHTEPMDYKRLAEIKENLAVAMLCVEDSIIVSRRDLEDLLAEFDRLHEHYYRWW